MRLMVFKDTESENGSLSFNHEKMDHWIEILNKEQAENLRKFIPWGGAKTPITGWTESPLGDAELG